MALRSFVKAGVGLRKCLIPISLNYLQVTQPITTLTSEKWNNKIQNVYTPLVLTIRKESAEPQQIKKSLFALLRSHLTGQEISTTESAAPQPIKKSIYSRLANRFTGRELSSLTLKRAALKMYLCTADLVDFNEIIERFKLPDTVNSWSRISELHMWMLLCRLSREGPDGKYCKKAVVDMMWEDIEIKIKRLKDISTSNSRKEGLVIIGEQFKASILSYDEGLLDSDKTLASALWRNFFDRKCEKIVYLETLLEYVHKQTAYLESIPRNDLLTTGLIRTLPIFEDESKRGIYERKLADIQKKFM